MRQNALYCAYNGRYGAFFLEVIRVEPIGLYIHVPFCLSKCPLLRFLFLRRLRRGHGRLYGGGGAGPGGLGRPDRRAGGHPVYWRRHPLPAGRRPLARLVEASRRGFGLRDAEITLEANPADDLAETLRAFAAAGGSRLSLGMQSADPDELRLLGRRHTTADVERAVRAAVRAGLDNLSLDMMLGLPGQRPETVERSAAVCRELGASHVSAYLLKIEPGTPFAARELCLPDEDGAADLYLAAAGALEAGATPSMRSPIFPAPAGRAGTI